MHRSLIKFANHFKSNSISRGYELYMHGAVYNARKVDNSYFFDIDGLTDNYETSISFDENNEVEECYCSCPHYASGNLCKHLYASLLKLNAIFEGKDKSLIVETKSTNNVDNELLSSFIIDDDNDAQTKNTKISNNDLAKYRIYCNTSDVNTLDMNGFLNKFDLNSHELATLFLMLRKPKPMEIFLNHYEDKIDGDFFKEVNLSLFPMNTSFKALVPYLLKHSNMLQYLDNDSLKEIFSHHRIRERKDRITLFFLCLNLNISKVIIIFFMDPENILNFFETCALINYMKANLTKEQIVVALDLKTRLKTLTRMEAAFLYPYFSEETKKDYDQFFKNNYAAQIGSTSYHVYYDYNYEFYYGLSLNRPFYELLKVQPTNDLTIYDLKIMYYLREQLFTGNDKLIFAKRFKQLSQTLFRSRTPDYEKIYCCLSIILEYGDNNSIINSLESKAIDYILRIYNLFDCRYAEIYELFYKLTQKAGSKENKIISNYHEGA